MDNFPELVKLAWLYLKAKRLSEEAEERHNEWVSRQQAHIKRWEDTYQKNKAKLLEVEARIARLNSSRKDALTVNDYKELDERLEKEHARIKEINRSNRDLQFKIEDVIRTLRGQPSKRPVRQNLNVVRNPGPLEAPSGLTIRFKR